MFEIVKECVKNVDPIGKWISYIVRIPYRSFHMNQPVDCLRSMWLIEDYFKPILREGQQVLSKFSEHSDYL